MNSDAQTVVDIKDASSQAPQSCWLKKCLFPAGLPFWKSLLILLLVFTLSGYIGFLGWFADLASHFRMQYTVLCLGLLVVLLIQKRPRWALLALAGLVINAVEVLPVYGPSHDTAAPSQLTGRLKLMHMNVLVLNRSHPAIIEAIRKENPDVVSLQEIGPWHLKQLQPVLKAYPYHFAFMKEKNFSGLAMYSRIPFRKTDIRTAGFMNRHILIGTVASNLQDSTQDLTIVSTHPSSPYALDRYQERNSQMEGIADILPSMGPNRVVVGDLNNSPYSLSFKNFLRKTGLRDSRQGFGYQASWPSFFPLAWIPIDHVLVSNHVVVLNRRVGPFIGSDHFPVMVELGLLRTSNTSHERLK